MSEVDSAEQVLAGTEAAVYAYGLVAARVPAGRERTRALDAMAWHRDQRDALRARITALGSTPPAAAAAYDPPAPVADAATARALAALVEDRLAGQWAALSAAASGATRTDDALTAQDCAIRVVAWSGTAPVWNGAV